MSKDTLDNKKQLFTEADMWRFALDYMERFQYNLCLKGYIEKNQADEFLTENIKRYLPKKNKIKL